MSALAFFPNIGFQPVNDEVRVSVLYKDKSFKEGEAKDFDWRDGVQNPIQGWREMQPDEVLHKCHRVQNTFVCKSGRV